MSTTTPDMGLTQPEVATAPGPAWAEQINADLDLIDGHDHSDGKGPRVGVPGLNINADLPFNANKATEVAGVILESLPAAPTGAENNNQLFDKNGDLWFRDGNGNLRQLTPAPGLVPTGVTPGSYTNVNLTVDAYGRITVAANGGGGSGGAVLMFANEIATGGEGGPMAYMSNGGLNGSSSTLASAYILPACTLSNLRVNPTSNTGGAFDCVVYKNGVATSLKVTCGAGSTTKHADTTHTVTFNGTTDTFDLVCIETTGTPIAADVSATLQAG